MEYVGNVRGGEGGGGRGGGKRVDWSWAGGRCGNFKRSVRDGYKGERGNQGGSYTRNEVAKKKGETLR